METLFINAEKFLLSVCTNHAIVSECLTIRFPLSDGWADRNDVVEGYEQEALGGISVRIRSPYVDDFDPYYFSLKPHNNSRNPWFKEFWEWRFNCSLSQQTSEQADPASLTGESHKNHPGNMKSDDGKTYKMCTGK